MHLCTICEIIFLVGGPWKSNVALEKSLKNSCSFLYEPCMRHIAALAVQFCAEDITLCLYPYTYTKYSSRVMKKISNKFHQWALYPFSEIQLVVYYQWCIRWLVELLLGYMLYRKIPKISPGAYIFQRPFLRGLFLEWLIFGGAHLRREIYVSKSIRLAL